MLFYEKRMENPSTSASIMSSESLGQIGKSMENVNLDSIPHPLQQSRNLSQGHVAILWDIENCPVPSDVRPEDVAGNIRMALRVHPVIRGAVTLFSAYGDFNAFPRRLREGCQRTGVKLVDVPNGRKDAADKAILVDMFLFALDNPPPSFIMLISGDVDFAPALHILGQRGYSVILVIPSNVGVSSALCNAGSFVWDWPSVARGEGFLPPAKAYSQPRGNPNDLATVFLGCHINTNADGQNEEEAIVYRGVSQKFCDTRDFSMVSQSFSEYNSCSASIPIYPTTSRSTGLPSAINEVSGGNPAPCDQYNLTWVQPGDLNGLKGQLVNLLQLSGGCLPLTRVPAEYQKMYGRPLYISEYGAPKLVNLFKKMADALAIEGKGQKKFVHVRNSRGGQSSPSFVQVKQVRKGKGAQDDSIEIMAGTGSSEELSDEERVVIEENERTGVKPASQMTAHSQVIDQSIATFKYELQDILVSYSCRVFLGSFEAIYEQRYKRPLEYLSFGVNKLEELLEKVKDVAVLQEEPLSKRKFLVAVGG